MVSYILDYFNGSLDIVQLVLVICVLIFVSICCLPVHEFAHAWTAHLLGDDTGKLKGRLSLNPFAHLTLVGTLMVLLFGFGYAKPVPVNIRNFKHRKLGFALTAIAGPLSNILLAVIFIFIANLANVISNYFPALNTLAGVTISFFILSSQFNIMLAVFNLIPIPPLDGSRILTMVLPDKYYYKLLSIERYFIYILFFVMFIFNRIGFSPLTSITAVIFDALSFVVGFPFIFLLK